PHAEGHAGSAELAVLATTAAFQDHALRPADALGAAPGPDHAEAPPRSLPGVEPTDPVAAPVPATDARNAAPAAAALWQAAGDLAGGGKTAGAGGVIPRLCRRRLLPPDQPEHGPRPATQWLRGGRATGPGLLWCLALSLGAGGGSAGLRR